MARATVNLNQLSRHTANVRQVLNRDLPATMMRAGKKAGATFDAYVRDQVPPAVRKQAAAKFWTPKQRRWWWYTMSQKALGKSRALPGWTATFKMVDGRKTLVISGGYVRTGTMVKSLTYKVTQTAKATTVVYGTNRAYAKYVIGPEKDQAKYHAGNWPRLPELARTAAPRVIKAFDDAISADLDRQLGLGV